MNARKLSSTRAAMATAVVLGAAVLLSACQVGLGDDDAKKATDRASQVALPASTKGPAKRTLTPEPVAPNGVARIDGSTRGSLTAEAVSAYNQAGGSAEVSVGNNGAESAFERLCKGGIDMVDSARSISARELASCSEHGLQVVQFQFASDAVVLAIKSETDVGGDCLTLDQVDDIYRAGSPITNWSDVGFDNVPIRVAGPDRNNNAFDFFGRTVLGAPEPSMTYLRSDYLAYSDDSKTRIFVVGYPLAQEQAKLASHYELLVTSRKGVLTQAKSNLAAAQATASAALAERRKGIIDGRSQAAQKQDQARLTAARQALQVAKNAVTHQQNLLNALQAPTSAAVKAQKAIAGLRGRLAYFRFTYYELFEDDLRPFEISTDGKTKNCIFPSEETITSGAYPLSRRLLVTTTTRSLGRKEVQDFLAKYLTTARTDAVSNRLVPIPDAVVTQQLAWIRGTQQPRILTPADLSNQPAELEQAK